MTFDQFVGNEKVISHLRAKLRSGRFPHGLIFSGPEGVGKYTCALMVAKALNCQYSQAGDFCNECASCRKTDASTHPDVWTISIEEDATQIKIAQIRQALHMLHLQPLEGRSKIFIIDPANSLNPEASNALLKALEEPAENSFFILITVNVWELLLTVRSRCQVYSFVPLSVDEIRQHGIPDELTIRWSQGSIGRARSLDLKKLRTDREFVLDFLETVITAKEEQFQNLLATSAVLGRGKLDFESRLEVLAVIVGDLLYLKEGVPGKLINIDIPDRLEKLASGFSADRLIRLSEFLGFIESSLKGNVNRQMLTDVLALTANEIASEWIT
jgi:DNA polymerase-3 subunit delta'